MECSAGLITTREGDIQNDLRPKLPAGIAESLGVGHTEFGDELNAW